VFRAVLLAQGEGGGAQGGTGAEPVGEKVVETAGVTAGASTPESVISTSSPGDQRGCMPPLTFETMRVAAPSSRNTRIGNVISRSPYPS